MENFSVAPSSEELSHPQHEPAWNIPVRLTSFVGREREIQQISALLQNPQVRMLTMIGAAGVGKTSLSIQVAHKLRGQFSHGIYFVPLLSAHSVDTVLDACVHALNLTVKGEYPILEQINNFLQGKHILLLLDNFEHLISATAVIEELLQACSQLKILVTSRTVLYISGEHEYPIRPLRIPPNTQALRTETLLEYEVIVLFLQRVMAILPAFGLTQENAVPITQICRHLDGLPLAIELAAARIKMFPPHVLLGKLAQRFSLLTSGAHPGPHRQQTLWVTITWSYNLLDMQEQYLFRLLAVFRDGATLDAIQHLALLLPDRLQTPVEDILSSLLDKSLLTYQDESESVGERRFLLLETMQAYALERLQEQDELERLSQAHAAYYHLYARQWEHYLRGPEQHSWLIQFDQERENFRAALQWLLDHNETEMLLTLCCYLFRFWYLRGYWNEARTWMKFALDQAEALPSTAVYARLLSYYGEIIFYQNDLPTSQQALEKCLSLCEGLALSYERAYVHYRLGLCYHEQGHITKAQAYLQEAEQECRSGSYRWELAHVLRAQGFIAWNLGDSALTVTLTRESLDIARETGDEALIAKVLSLLAAAVTLQGDTLQAIHSYQEILIMARRLDDRYLVATTLQNLGYLLAQQEETPQAVDFIQQGLAIFRELGYTLLIVNTLHSLGSVLSRQGNLHLAMLAFREGLSLALAIANDTQIGWHLIGSAGVLALQGQFQHATHLLGAATRYFDVNAMMNKAEQAEYHALLQTTRKGLDSVTFEQCWLQGQALPLPHLLAEQIDHADASALSAPASDIGTGVLTSSKEIAGPFGLTRREIEILYEVAQGLTDGQIADKLVISKRTVSWHIGNIYGKLHVTTRSAATRIALEHGIV